MQEYHHLSTGSQLREIRVTPHYTNCFVVTIEIPVRQQVRFFIHFDLIFGLSSSKMVATSPWLNLYSLI